MMALLPTSRERMQRSFWRGLPRPVRTAVIVPIVLLSALVILCAGLLTFKVLFPTPGVERPSDVVISLSPGQHRLPKSLELYRAGASDQLAVSWYPTFIDEAKGSEHSWGQLENEICRDVPDPRIHCFTPVENSTRGESLAVRELAEQHNWQSVTVVTSRYHAFRTKFIFNRYLPPSTDIEVITAPTDLELNRWIYHIAYENAAFFKAVFESTVS